MQRALYSDSTEAFCRASPAEILGAISQHFLFPIEPAQRDAWLQEIDILKPVCERIPGRIHFEFAIPRMGRYVDVVLTTFPEMMARIGASLPRSSIDPLAWECGKYSPTPTIIEAAMALYRRHNVQEISRSEVQAFIQNVHHFRDECLIDADSPPHEHVTIFDEAQRAWNLEQTSRFMQSKKGRPGFRQSEPEFLLS